MFREMQRRRPGGLGGMPERKCCVRAGTQRAKASPGWCDLGRQITTPSFLQNQTSFLQL